MQAGCRKTHGLLSWNLGALQGRCSGEELRGRGFLLLCRHSTCLSYVPVVEGRMLMSQRWMSELEQFSSLFCCDSICVMQVKGKWLQPFFEKKSPFSDLIYWQLSKIHERGNASGSQVFPDKPLCAVPVEAFGGVSDAWKVYTRFVGKNTKIIQRNCQWGFAWQQHFLCLRSARAEL